VGALVARFGRSFALNFDDIDRAVFAQLAKDRQALRKRAIYTLGHLVDVVENEHFDRVVDRVLKGCEEAVVKGSASNLRTYISAATAVCKASPSRFAHFLPRFVPLLMKAIEQVNDDELKEACLHAFETFLQRCIKAAQAFVPEIVRVCGEAIKYDPNYNYDDGDENGAEQMDVNGSDVEVSAVSGVI